MFKKDEVNVMAMEIIKSSQNLYLYTMTFIKA